MVEFTCEAILSWTFVCFCFFNYWFSFIRVVSLLTFSVSFWSSLRKLCVYRNLSTSFIYLFFYIWSWGIWDLSSPNRSWTCTPALETQSLDHWTTREVPYPLLLGFPPYWTIILCGNLLWPFVCLWCQL